MLVMWLLFPAEGRQCCLSIVSRQPRRIVGPADLTDRHVPHNAGNRGNGSLVISPLIIVKRMVSGDLVCIWLAGIWREKAMMCYGNYRRGIVLKINVDDRENDIYIVSFPGGVKKASCSGQCALYLFTSVVLWQMLWPGINVWPCDSNIVSMLMLMKIFIWCVVAIMLKLMMQWWRWQWRIVAWCWKLLLSNDKWYNVCSSGLCIVLVVCGNQCLGLMMLGHRYHCSW